MGKKWTRYLFTRRMIFAYAIIIQLGFFFFLIISGSNSFVYLAKFFRFLSTLVAIHIITKREKDAYKLTWVFLVLLFPIFGGLMYIMFYRQTSRKKVRKRIEELQKRSAPLLTLPEYRRAEDAFPPDAERIQTLSYLESFAGFPSFDGTKTEYLPTGEEFIAELTRTLEEAKRYIFLEFFIISDGKVWSDILEVLKRKAAAGVCVRLIYDDFGCFFRLPQDYRNELKKYGIECYSFNKFRPIITVDQNNRDHRKIAVIDGKYAFTGGTNLADEYANLIDRFGHWKDCGIKLYGKASWSFAVIFLRMWGLCSGIDEDMSAFLPEEFHAESDGIVQPYADSPVDNENVGEHVYLQMINNSKNYLYITTPYLIVDRNMSSALCLAAKSGVDVRIITPHRWDKRLVHITTRSYYRELIRAGVRVYEYLDGFIHSKTFVSDDIVASCGTTNLDFRSLYLHFECGTFLYRSDAVMQIKEDFLETLKSSAEITEENLKENFATRLVQDFLRVFAPLM